ncbi:MAG: M16 family metallopeptidase [Clostridium sp.]
MKEIILKNNLKLIYKHSESELTSICVSINAGAGIEDNKMGVAHAVEHMVYKGTKKRSEAEINEELSNIFGFQNAMTNYPYVIYYGTLLNEDLEKGLELFSDIILNPEFDECGFKEEMEVIKEELEEWDEDVEQFCEDRLFYNAFNKRRIKYPIIGTKESLNSISTEDIQNFYQNNYLPENVSISVISSMDFDKVLKIVFKYFGGWRSVSEYRNCLCNDIIYKDIYKDELFSERRNGVKNAKVQIIFPLEKLSYREMNAFRIFNQYFGEGVNSILFDTLRTKNSLVYDVLTKISHENYLKMYKITFTTSKENVEKAVDIIMNLTKDICSKDIIFDDSQLTKLIKSYKLKRLFREEQSIILAKELATYDTMFGDYNIYCDEFSTIDEIKPEDVLKSAKKVLKDSSVQIIY